MVVTVPLNQADNSVPIVFIILDANWNPVDLTNASGYIKFEMALPGYMIQKTNGSMTLLSATLGTVQYVFTAQDLSDAATYEAEIEATYSTGNASGRVITVQGISVVVSPEET